VEEAEHLRVYKDDLPVESGYTVRLLENGGSVVFAAAPAAGSAVAVERNVPTTQEVDLQNNTAFLPEVLEGALDKLTMICQQLQSRLARSMVLPPTRTETDETIYSWFLELSENAERWAKEARSGAATAKADAAKAKSSADEAYLSKLTAAEAAAKAGKSEAETGSMRGEVARMYDDSSLNRAHLVFGEWGTLEGMYINYEDWTDTETLIGLTAALAAHNADGSAHPGFAKKTEVESARNSAVSEARMPAGCVTAFAGSGTVPAGWFVCDGHEVSRGEHPELFAAIGVTYGDGDGSTTFNLPDFRGRFLRGYLGELSGEIGAEQAEGLPDVDLALRMDNPNVRANVKAAPRMDEAVYGSDGYAVTDTTGTDEYMIRQSDLIDREKAGQLVKSAVYGRSEHVTPMNFAVQWIIKN
jgi:microcystin-dependent protein